jgi:hypothetical protein
MVSRLRWADFFHGFNDRNGSKVKNNNMCKHNSKSFDWCVEHCPEEDWFLCPDKILMRDKKAQKQMALCMVSYILFLITLILTLIIII